MTQSPDGPQIQQKPAPLHRFWRGQVRYRWSRIAWHWHPALAAVIAVAVTLAVPRTTAANLTIREVSTAGLAYAALSFGACVTSAVLALAFPSEERLLKLASTGRDGSLFSHYSDLVFTFAWSAIAQLALVVAIALAYVFGGEGVLWPENPHLTHVVLFVAAMFVTAYSVIRLFNVVATLVTLAYVVERIELSSDDED